MDCGTGGTLYEHLSTVVYQSFCICQGLLCVFCLNLVNFNIHALRLFHDSVYIIRQNVIRWAHQFYVFECYIKMSITEQLLTLMPLVSCINCKLHLNILLAG